MNRSGFTDRSGFTVREMVVVLAVLALLFTAIVPGCSQDTTAARNACRNQMKVLALGIQNHHDAYKTMPPLFFSRDPEKLATLSPLEAAECYSWHIRMLPFIQQDTLYKNFSQTSQKFSLPSTSIAVVGKDGKEASPSQFNLPELICVAVPDPLAPGTSHYVALSTTRLPLLLETEVDRTGKLAFKYPPDGMLIPDSQSRGQSMSRMADGTSKTALLAESRESARSNWYLPQQTFVAGILPEDSTATMNPKQPYYPYFELANSKWTPNPKTDRTALNYGPTADKASQAYHGVKGDPLERTWGPSSAHSGMVVHGMGDGSVLEVKTDVDPKIYFAGITARGGEAVPSLSAP